MNRDAEKPTGHGLSVTVVIVVLLLLMSTVPLLVGVWRMIRVGENFLRLKVQEQQITDADVIAAEIEQETRQALDALHDLAALRQYLAWGNVNMANSTANLRQVMEKTYQEGNWLALELIRQGQSEFSMGQNFWQQLHLTEVRQQAVREALAFNTWSSPPVVQGNRVYRVYAVLVEGRPPVMALGIRELTPLQKNFVRYRTPERFVTLISTGQPPRILLSSDPELLPIGHELEHPMAGVTATRQSIYRVRYGDRVLQVSGVARPLHSLNAILLLETDTRYALAMVRQMAREGITWAAGVGLLMIALAILTGNLVSNPVRHLAHMTQEIARNRSFHHRLQVRGLLEFRRLREAFNSLLNEIQEYIRQLEEKAEENRRLFYDSVRMLTAAIDAKDPYTRGHSERVSEYARVIANYMDLTPEEREQIYLAGLLHDVGKIGVQDRILQKPAALTDEEYEIMKTHPEKGYKIMREIEQLKNVVPGMRYHHEAWDGSGYPFGLKGTEIPLVARIIAVADSLDAMTTNRPYQRRMSLEKAAERIVMLSGKRFDPRVVEAFVRAYEDGAIRIIEEQETFDEETLPGITNQLGPMS